MDARPDRAGRWRVAVWGFAATVLLLPLIAMQFTDEVAWNLADFLFAGIMVAGAGIAFEITVRMTRNRAYRAAIGVAVATTIVLIWTNLAVGIIGSEDNPANLMFAGVLAVGAIGSLIARFKPQGMARVLALTALAQALVAAIALSAGLGFEVVPITLVFAALWLTSAWLFRKAAREPLQA